MPHVLDISDEMQMVVLRGCMHAMKEAVAELLCPMTLSLPFDPVIAEDGKVYERSAIEEWLKQQRKSPVTNLAIGTKLLPALHVKTRIFWLVSSGALMGDTVDAWKQKLEEEEEVIMEEEKEKVAEMLRKRKAEDDQYSEVKFWPNFNV